MRRVLSALAIAAVAACSSSESPAIVDSDAAPTGDAGARDDGGSITGDSGATSDGGGNDASEPFTTQTEQEPNDGKTTTEVGTMKIPGQMTGKIDPANDVDIFSIALSPGDFWEWTLTPASADLHPHLTIFDTATNSLNPTVLAKGTTLEHFVLRPGSFVAAVRDARNVPTASGFGGPTYGYTLVARRKTIAPVVVTFPATKTGTLASLSAVALFQFTGTKGFGFDIVVKAARKVPASTLDSRLSLFDATTKTAIITNDDASSTTTDSQVGGTLPESGDYIVILENEGTNAADLSYEVDFTAR